MKVKKMIALFLAVILMSCPFSMNVEATSARGAILMEQDSGRVLYDKNAHTEMRIASITKIMTAILAIESGKLDEYVTVSKRAAYTEGSSIYLQPKQKIKLRDLTYGLMLRSGNDAAVAIAEHVSDDLDNFVKEMNKKAAEIGMKNTIFANPHGLDDHENHYSTAYDMALLTRYAMKNPTYREISATKKYAYEDKGRAKYIWRNKNKLLTQLYPSSTGGKTGYTKRAKRTLVSTASKNGLNLIAVTINDGNDWQDHIHLFEHAFSKYKQVEIINKEEAEFTHADVLGGLELKEDIVYPLTENEIDKLSVSIQLFKGKAVKKARNSDKSVGKVKVFLEEEQIGEANLYSKTIKQEEDQTWTEKLKKWLD
ncbi:D-alanyl-D-alanine carboxypeptidase family protein [Bacillus sp. B15-48]|uniref:D-alanyl-D-alanine carboxypeptidase family protein n=1 Tax=Bacillus sp. B15-48 TaxID=1548601 RepID=UPI00193EC962|nr:D-alanyl-D-alanine carboxypeptidase family protein [Bacillus sp. B15-48]MBM4762994.1 D-alanyl-D-alanine carboxypeptidase [Bacillus sp. B15-48]